MEAQPSEVIMSLSLQENQLRSTSEFFSTIGVLVTISFRPCEKGDVPGGLQQCFCLIKAARSTAFEETSPRRLQCRTLNKRPFVFTKQPSRTRKGDFCNPPTDWWTTDESLEKI